MKQIIVSSILVIVSCPVWSGTDHGTILDPIKHACTCDVTWHYTDTNEIASNSCKCEIEHVDWYGDGNTFTFSPMSSANFISICGGNSYYDRDYAVGNNGEYDCITKGKGYCNTVKSISISKKGGSIDCDNERTLFSNSEQEWSCTNWNTSNNGTITINSITCEVPPPL